jgi:hypothetical protein
MTAHGVCLKEFYWNGKTYRPEEAIVGEQRDMRILEQAQVITIDRDERVETATIHRPENTARRQRR